MLPIVGLLEELDLHFRSEQNVQHSSSRPAGNFMIAIPVEWARPTMQGMLPLATEDTSRIGFIADARAWERGAPNATRRNILVITIFEMCLHAWLVVESSGRRASNLI